MKHARYTLIIIFSLITSLLLWAGGSGEKETASQAQQVPEEFHFSPYSGDDGLTGKEIMEKANDTLIASDISSDIIMTLENDKGNKRVRELSIKSKESDGLSRSVLHFRSPADIEGTGFLMIETPDGDSDMWLYLPELGKVRKIVSSGKGDSFMGSDITYSDMEGKNIEEFTYTRFEDEIVDSESCYVIEAASITPDSEDGYARTVYKISKEKLVPLQAFMFSTNGTNVKQMHIMDVINMEGSWIPTLIEVEDTEKHHKTIMNLLNVEMHTSPDDSYFTQQYLKRGN